MKVVVADEILACYISARPGKSLILCMARWKGEKSLTKVRLFHLYPLLLQGSATDQGWSSWQDIGLLLQCKAWKNFNFVYGSVKGEKTEGWLTHLLYCATRFFA